MKQYQTRVRRMRPERDDTGHERAAEDRQSWFQDRDIVRAKAFTAHVRETGILPATGQEDGS